MTWTPAQLESERRYRYDERLGILCDRRKPTLSQLATAAMEADEAVEALRKQDEQKTTKNTARRSHR